MARDNAERDVADTALPQNPNTERFEPPNQDALRQEDRRAFYIYTEPDSTPELVEFINCTNIEQIKKLDDYTILQAARSIAVTVEE